MNGNTTNIDDLNQAMTGIGEVDDVNASTDDKSVTNEATKDSNSILAKAKQVFMRYGIPAAVVAAVVALAFYVVRTENTRGHVRMLKMKGANKVIGDEIRNRVRANAVAFRILGLVANQISKNGGKDVGTHLQDGTPPDKRTFSSDKQAFLDALSSYIEAQAVASGLNETILTLIIVEDKNPDAIENAIQKQMEESLDEKDLKRAVMAIVTALIVDVSIPDGSTEETFLSQNVTLIRNALDQIELKQLLTAPTNEDLKDTPADDIKIAEGMGFNKGQAPFKGLGTSIKAKVEGLR